MQCDNTLRLRDETLYQLFKVIFFVVIALAIII
jgi:hypothetical protein